MIKIRHYATQYTGIWLTQEINPNRYLPDSWFIQDDKGNETFYKNKPSESDIDKFLFNNN